MHINLFLIPFVIILGLLFGTNDNKRNRLLYILSSSVVLVFVAAMRSPEYMTYMYGIDTLNYQRFFEQSFDMGWDEFWEAVRARYVGLNDEADVGFLGLNKIISYFTHDFHIYSIYADLIFFIPFGVLLYRYCTSMKQIIFAFVFYVALIQVFFFGGARQIFAIGFDLMALLSILRNKRIRSLLLLLVGVTIHFSSFLFLIPLLMIWYDANPRVLKVLHLSFFLLFPIVLMMPNTIISFMGNMVGSEKYADYGSHAVRGGATTFIVLVELMSLFCLAAIKVRDMRDSKILKDFYIMAPLFTVLAPLIHSNGTMIRISLYFHLFLTLLIPFAIDCMFKTDNRRIVYFLAIGLLSFFALADGGTLYYFYWQK